MSQASRQSDYAIAPLFIDRWSPRAFTGEVVADEALRTAFEAARWAPSSRNYQPWRFLYARSDSPCFGDFLSLLNERNRQWAHRAGAIVYILSDTLIGDGVSEALSDSHAFDTGAAWANFAHQIHLLGYGTRAIGGFDRQAAPGTLGLSDRFHVHAAVAVGRPAARETLPDAFQAREFPSPRNPLDAFVFEDQFTGS